MADSEFALDPPAGLTWGLELEFLVFLEEAGDPNPEDHRWFLRAADAGKGDAHELVHRKVVEVLRSAQIPCVTLGETFGDRASMEQLAAGQGISIKPGHDPLYSFWSVTNDSTVVLRSEDAQFAYYDAVGVELMSPVYVDFDRCRDEVSRVCRAVREALRVAVNKSAGLHVHVSESREPDVLGLSLLTAKKALSLYLPVEEMVYDVCAPWRSSPAANPYAPRLMGLSHLALPDAADGGPMPEAARQHVPDNVEPRLRDALRRIWLADSMDALQDGALRPQDRAHSRCGLAIGFFPRDGRPVGDMLHTMEARMLQGTLDPELIVNWARFVVAWLGTAASLGAPEFKTKLGRMCHRLSTPDFYTHGDMFHDLGIQDRAAMAFWQKYLEDAPYADDDNEFFLPPLR